MDQPKCDRCAKALDEADLALNFRRNAEYLRRYPEAGISDNFGDRPVFRILCAACVAGELYDQEERRKRQSLFDALAQGESHPDFSKNFLIVALVIFVLGIILLSGR